VNQRFRLTHWRLTPREVSNILCGFVWHNVIWQIDWSSCRYIQSCLAVWRCHWRITMRPAWRVITLFIASIYFVHVSVVGSSASFDLHFHWTNYVWLVFLRVLYFSVGVMHSFICLSISICLFLGMQVIRVNLTLIYYLFMYLFIYLFAPKVLDSRGLKILRKKWNKSVYLFTHFKFIYFLFTY